MERKEMVKVNEWKGKEKVKVNGWKGDGCSYVMVLTYLLTREGKSCFFTFLEVR